MSPKQGLLAWDYPTQKLWERRPKNLKRKILWSLQS